MSDFHLEVVPIEGKGRGVVAKADLPRGEVLAVNPVISMPAGALDETPLEDHPWHEDGQDHLTLGIQSLCNHDETPNCVSVVYDGMDLLISIRPISKGEELTLNYNDFCEIGWQSNSNQREGFQGKSEH